MISGVTNFLPRAAGARPGHAQRPAGAQTRRQLAAQRATALHVQGLVDRLVRDPHRLIIGEVEPGAGCAICSGLHDRAQRRSARRP